MEQYFPYGDKETTYLRGKDKSLAAVIDELGMLQRKVIPDLFEALVHAIVGQQISTKAHETIWKRVLTGLGEITPEAILRLSPKELQSFGMTFRKVTYIRAVAEKIVSGVLDIHTLSNKSDTDICTELSALEGIGVWTAEMLLLHSLQRTDILSFVDLAIHRGLRMLYRHRKITRTLFESYRRRYSPYGSVASLYLWAISAGAVEGLVDPAEKGKDKRKIKIKKK